MSALDYNSEMSFDEFETYEKAEAFPEYRLVKREIISDFYDACDLQEEYMIGSKNPDQILRMFVSKMETIYIKLRSNIKAHCIKVIKKKHKNSYKKLFELNKYQTNVDSLIEEKSMKEIFAYFELISDFIYEVGISKIEVNTEIDPSHAVLEGMGI